MPNDNAPASPNPQQTALAKRKEAEAKIVGTYHAAEAINARLGAAAKTMHLISPATSVTTLPEGCAVAISSVYVDVERDTYKTGGGKVGLSKAALDQIAGAAGVSWDPRESGRVDDGSDPHYCRYRVVGTVRDFGGSLLTRMGDKEMDLREGSQQLVGKSEAQVREMRSFILAHAETKARLRAIRSLGIRTSYTPADLETTPFACAKLQWTGRTNDPALARVFAERTADAMLGGMAALYGPAPSAPTAPALPPPPVRPAVPALPRGNDADDIGDDDLYDEPVDEAPAASAPAAKAAAPPAAPAPASGTGRGNTRAPKASDAFRFGRSQGMKFRDGSDDDCAWYAKALAENVADPEKARFKAQNEADLAAVNAEIAARRGEVDVEDEPDLFGDRS